MTRADAAPLAPGSTIGIIGGGQLGRMLAMSAAQLGLHSNILSPDENCPAGECAARLFVGAYEDEKTLQEFAAASDVVTYEFENVPAGAIRFLASQGRSAAPGERALEIAQDRLLEKKFVNDLGGATAPYFPVEDIPSLEEGLRQIGRPAILKTRRLGYDGKGQTRLKETPSEGSDAAVPEKIEETWRAANEKAWAEIGAKPSILEGFIDFIGEFSIIGARSVAGEIKLYDPAHNIHVDGILAKSIVPHEFDDITMADAAFGKAAALVEKMMNSLDYVGVIGVEFFLTRTGDILVNEFAPRVHNSGHWTMDACAVSQFEQHIRAIAGWPLADPARHSNAVMENLLGEACQNWATIAEAPQTALHLYGKAEALPGRKMGHINRLSPRD